MSVLKQMKQALKLEGNRLFVHRLSFGRRWDIRLDMQGMEDHSRTCRKLIRNFKPQDSYVGYGGLSDNEIDEVVDVDHWGDEE